jgi:hypothetical protein
LSEVDATVVSGTHKDGALAQKFPQRTMPVGSPRSRKEQSNG